MTTNRAQLTDADAIRTFLTGGNARATIAFNTRGGASKRYTYRVRVSDDGARFFVSLLVGADNDSDFEYLGNFRLARFGAELFPKRGREHSANSLPFRAFQRFTAQIAAGNVPASAEFWHEGRCCRCGRALTVPESIASGIGPKCAERAA